ncbi:ABC transporter ATP-binding protein [Devosia sp. 1566]|uniref:ABC transporter ATP-binding protein n=1 Tax=Devosia sp. 1566 TaxID=2499144 RepID=UPI000FDCB893|nr:ABC transporter ATP-binding protein [Devosia sp. 1566]
MNTDYAAQANTSSPILKVSGLSVDFGASRVVEDLSFSVRPGETLAIVGESGSGKSVTSLSVMRLVEYGNGRIVSGEIRFDAGNGPQDLAQASDADMRRIRGNDIAMIFQEPMTSLNPVYTVGNQISEVLTLHRGLSRSAARTEAVRLLSLVRLADAESMLDRYPHQLSGGMRQRVMIAIALACQPKVLIADEPTTALDVTIQAQILAILADLQRELGMAVVFITHDMGVVAEIADRVVVMWRGRKVEEGFVSEIFANPQHAYTKTLLAAVPRLGAMKGRELPRRLALTVMDGEVPRRIGKDRDHDTADLSAAPIAEIRDLTVRFNVGKTLLGRVTHRVHAVEHVSLDLRPGETLALVGESGSGKSTIGRTLQGLQPATSGQIFYQGSSVADMTGADAMRLKREIQYIFQDPFASLDPRKSVGFSIAEPIRTHGLIKDEKALQARVAELLVKVDLDPSVASRYPHQFSGGQRQRISIARALSCDPKLIIADEALSALDVSVQAQVIELMMALQEERSLAYLFISHDMAVVERMAHRVAVLYLGQVVEIGTRRQVFENATHSYTRRLLAAVPRAEPGKDWGRTLMEGEIPSPVRPVGQEPTALSYREVAPGHLVAIED